MAKAYDPYRLTSPRIFLLIMVIFLIIVGFVAAILSRQISSAFMSNPGLNGLILGVLGIGVIMGLVQVIRLMPEVSWVNSFRQGASDLDTRRKPVLLAPMAALLGQTSEDMILTTGSMRSILESIGTRLDEARDISRYLIGLLVFLGLLGTFWGLLSTIDSIGGTIQGLDPGSGSANDILDTLKAGLSAPLDGMGTAFSSSLFGLSGSLVLGFLDLQSGRAQNRFYTELENWLSSITNMNYDAAAGTFVGDGSAEEIRNQLSNLANRMQSGGGDQRATAAMAKLAESIQGLVQHMRTDQQNTKAQIAAQAQQQKELLALMKNIEKFFEKAAGG